MSKTQKGQSRALRCTAFREKACRVDCIKWFTILVVGLLGLEQERGSRESGFHTHSVWRRQSWPHGAGGDPVFK